MYKCPKCGEKLSNYYGSNYVCDMCWFEATEEELNEKTKEV